VVAIPSHLLIKQNLKAGSRVVVAEMADGTGFVIKRVEESSNVKSGVGAEFKKWLKTVLSEDKEILDELSVR